MWQFDKDSVTTWYYQEGDEFNNDKLNTEYWSDWYGWARSISSNKEQQYYTQFKNHFIKDGKLILTAKRQDINARYIDWMSDNDSVKNGNKFDGLNKRNFAYSAGMIQSKKSFQYGYFEIKFKTPKEKGFWPAFWLYGGTPNEEIDWMELKSEKDNEVHVAIHCQKRSDEYVKTLFGKKTWGSWVKFKGSLSENYNIISGIWTPEGCKYYLNGECIGISEAKMPIPKFLVANIAVAHDKGPFHPGPVKDFKDSVNFEIDHIRIWGRYKNFEKQKNVSPISASSKNEIKKTKLSSKKKIHYGKKNKHKNEGFFATLMPQTDGKYQLTVLGKNIPENTTLIIKDNSGKTVSETKLNYGLNTLDALPGQNISIKAFDKEVNYTIN
jgi:beta-glucanase (GH16 family)